MNELIVYQGDDPLELNPSSSRTYAYRIGTGTLHGRKFIKLNDEFRLNCLAEKIRDKYSTWVFSLNSHFTSSSLVMGDLSVFFLSDLSCKRSERFETFDQICNLMLIQEQLADTNLQRARLIGVNRAFVSAFESVFPRIQISVEQSPKTSVRITRRLSADVVFIFKSIGVVLTNHFVTRRSSVKPFPERMFFSFFPQMFDDANRDTKYASLANDANEFAVTIMSDGMHQKVSLQEYIGFLKQAEELGMQVLDRNVKLSDVWRATCWGTRLWRWYFGKRGIFFGFEKIDVSGLVREELRFSISRITRLSLLSEALKRFLTQSQPRSLYYYPFEYPFGRMVSWVCAKASPDTERIGFQMSIVSKRRLEQFMAPGEAASRPPFIFHAPIPDKILVESDAAAAVYVSAGYQKVELMQRVYRYDYLDEIAPMREKGLCLIAPGLHDGGVMLGELSEEIMNRQEKTWIIKPHPRANNDYVRLWSDIKNVRVSEQEIKELLAKVSEVYVTYSSVGLEAQRLGLKVVVINVPGRVNTSPLLDKTE